MGVALRDLVKRLVERGIARTGIWRIARAVRRPPDLILAYHNVMPDGAVPGGDASLHVPRLVFRAQLRALLRTHEVVPLADLLRPGIRRGPRPRAAITFDDAYRGAVTVGLEELALLGLPATVFVAPGALGGGPFWWDRLGDGRAGLSQAFRQRALQEFKGEGERVLEAAAREGIPEGPVPGHAWPASEAELGEAAHRAGVSFGSHSWSHPNLAALPAERLAHELSAPLAWLRQRFPRVDPCLAYPYGLSSPDVQRAAALAGYDAALAVTGGALGPALDRFAVPRLNVPAGLTADGLLLRCCGVLRE